MWYEVYRGPQPDLNGQPTAEYWEQGQAEAHAATYYDGCEYIVVARDVARDGDLTGRQVAAYRNGRRTEGSPADR